ncbi:MAG: shikimate dehydrogenase [Pseudomonadota bacterium]
MTKGKRVDTSTVLFGVFGNPVAHSMGPVMHNAAFKKIGFNAVYLAFRITDIANGILAIRELGIRGVSITIPFKESVIPFLDEIDEDARCMGAVNTIVNQNGKLTGYNTDHRGAVEPLMALTSLQRRHVCILGAGGAAKAVAFGLKKKNAVITITNRTVSKGISLAHQVGAAFVSMDDFETARPDIIINTTSIGMTPNQDQTPLDKRFLHPGMIVMDIVYNPLETRFLKEAKTAGCRLIDGLSMFIHQGAAQFKLFTGKDAPEPVMRDAVLQAMRKV